MRFLRLLRLATRAVASLLGVSLLIAPADAQATVEIAYDAAAAVLSVHARQTPLNSLLEEIARAAKVHIRSSVDVSPVGVTVDLTRLPLERALKELLPGFNLAFIYEPVAGAGEGGASVQLTGVMLSPKGEGIPVGLAVA